jgi:hypothetical protein
MKRYLIFTRLNRSRFQLWQDFTGALDM